MSETVVLMQHQQTDYDELIVKYLDNEILPDEKSHLTAWVNESEANKSYFVEIAKAWESSIIELQDEKEAAGRLEDLLHQLETKKRHVVRRWLIGAAAAAVLILLGVQLFRYDLFPGKMITIAADDSKKEIILPDSSVVWLNTHSTLKYHKQFNKSRKVSLTGEAYFNVKKAANKTFTVHTDNFTISVLGTEFLVTDRSNATETETVLESGKIDLKVNTSGKTIKMRPNQRVIYNKQTDSITTQIVYAANYTAWREKKLSFENIRLKDVFTQLSKWYNIEISCENKSILETSVSFTVDKESCEDILGILQQVSAFSWKKTNDNTIMIY